ncbi:MAG: hypothetical protein HGA54_00720 [Actinobacteria bacterium]|nr:hypothetical protein [Actinomycetota bacterium]
MQRKALALIIVMVAIALDCPVLSFAGERASSIATTPLEDTQIGAVVFKEGVSAAEAMTMLYLDKGSISIGATSISGYDQNGILITTPNPLGYIITQTDPTTSITKTITITGGTHDIVLDGIYVDVSLLRYLTAVSVKAGATAHITLETGTVNSLRSSQTKAGLQVQAGAALILDGGGVLNVFGGSGLGATAIGGAPNDNGCGSITINGGTINANAALGSSCPAIGEGVMPGGTGIIEINGGNVTAIGASKASGIGGSMISNVLSITINGGVVIATGGDDGPGLGTGFVSGNSTPERVICITGGTVTATGGSRGAGIGGCGNGHGLGFSGGTIHISGGLVSSQGGLYAAAIGSGSGSQASSNTGSVITISGGTVYATRGAGANDIGNAYLNNTMEGPSNYIEIIGGSVKAASNKIYPAPWNGYPGLGESVYRTKVHLVGETSSAGLSGINSVIDSDYSFNGATTDNGYIYMYLPQSVTTSACLRDVSGYHGSVDSSGDSWLKLDQSTFRILADQVDTTSCQLDKPVCGTVAVGTTGGSGAGSVSYSSSDTGVGSISGSELNLLAEGTSIITAYKAAPDDSYYGASACFSLNVTAPQLTGTIFLTGVLRPSFLLAATVPVVQEDAVLSYDWVRVNSDGSEIPVGYDFPSYEIAAGDVGSRLRVYVSDATAKYTGSLVATSDIILPLTIDVSVPTSLDITVTSEGLFDVPSGQIENYSLCDVYLSEVNISWNEGPAGAGDILYSTGDVTWFLTLGEAVGATTYTFFGSNPSCLIPPQHGFIQASSDGITPIGMSLPWALSLREGVSIKYSPDPVNIATITYTVDSSAI